MIFELAYGARPELFVPSRRERGGKRKSTVPINSVSITALKVLLENHHAKGPVQNSDQADS